MNVHQARHRGPEKSGRRTPIDRARHSVAALALALAALAPAAGRAASLRFDDALKEADLAPSVAAAQRGLQAKRDLNGRISGLIANPQLSALAGYDTPGDPKGSLSFELGISQGWSLSGWSGARRHSADLEARSLELLFGSARFERQREVAASWLRLWMAQQAHSAALEESRLAGTFVERIERARALQALTAVDLSEAKAYRSEATLALLAAEGEEFEAGIDLARRLGRSLAEPMTVEGELPVAPEPSGVEGQAIVALAQRLPQVLALQQEVSAETAREVEIAASRGVLLQVGATLTHDTATGLGGQLSGSASLPTFDHGERERGSVAAERERLRGAYEMALAEATGEVAMALHEVAHTREVLEELSRASVPALEEAARQRARLLEAGEGSVVELLLSRRALVAGQSRLTRAKAEHAGAGWQWRLITEATVPAASPTAQPVAGRLP